MPRHNTKMLMSNAAFRHSYSCHEIGRAPRATMEETSYIDELDCDYDNSTDTYSAATSISQRSSVVTADSGRVSSQSTIKSPDNPEKEKKKKSKKMVVCRISLLDGSQFEPAGIDKNCTGQIVFEKVTQHLDILETDYFGLTYRDKTGKKFWLDNTKKVSKVVQGGTWVFEFQVKFYPPDPMSLKEDITRYQLCLQLRVDIFNGRLPCSFVTCALLGSYTVQAELGDWEPPGDNLPTGYLNDFDFSPVQNQELLDKICELHKHHKGQTPTVAEAHFLENAKKLAMYGVDMHDTKDQENKDIQLGVCSTGVLVYKDRLRINRFVWPRILKMSYKGNHFYIKIRPNEFDPHEKTVGFKCENHKLAKRLWKTCVEHHAFFRLKDADAPSSTAFPRFNTKFRYSGRTAAQARKAAEMADREEPHITRTAERKSLNYGHNKAPMLDDAEKKMLTDERDKLGQQEDPNATAEYDPSYAGFDHDGRSRALDDDQIKQNFMRLLWETPEIHSQSRWPEARQEIDRDPRFTAVPLEALREEWFNEYINDLVKEEYKQLLRDTPGITTTSKYSDVKPQISNDPRYQAVPSEALREQWFKEFTDDLVKEDYMQLLWETPDITHKSKFGDVKGKIKNDPRYKAVPSDKLREEWFNEFKDDVIKPNYMRLLRDTPEIHSQSRWPEARQEIDRDPRFTAVPSETLREAWFNEHVNDLLKDEYKHMLRDTPGITSTTKYSDVKPQISNDPRYQAVPSEALREKWFKEFTDDMMKEEYMQLLRETPDISGKSKFGDVKGKIKNDPRYKAVPSDKLREEWFNEYKNELLKQEYKQLIWENPGITPTTRYDDAKPILKNEPRYKAVPNDELREDWFEEYKTDRLKDDYKQLLCETPGITSRTRFDDVKYKIGHDPRYKAVPNDGLRQDWFHEYRKDLGKGREASLEDAADASNAMLMEQAREDEREDSPPLPPPPEQSEQETDTVIVSHSTNIGVSESDNKDIESGDYEVETLPRSELMEESVKQESVIVVQHQPYDPSTGQNESDYVEQQQNTEVDNDKAVIDEQLQTETVVNQESAMSVNQKSVIEEQRVNEEHVKTEINQEAESLESSTAVVDTEAEELVDSSIVENGGGQVLEMISEGQGDDNPPTFGVVGDIKGAETVVTVIVTDDQLKEDYTQLLRETPDVTSTSRLGDVKHKISHDPRYQSVPNDDLREDWFNEYTDDLLKQNYMRLLRETPQIHSQSTWQEARQEIDLDPRFQAVPMEDMRENWCNEYVHNLLKSEFMQMLKETPAIHSQSRWEGVKEYVEDDPRYKAVRSSTQREDWFDEYIQNLKKEEFMKLLRETPDITSYSRYNDVKDELRHDPRFQNVDTEAQREVYFKEHVQDLKKTGFVQLLVDTPEITAYSSWPQSKPLIDTDPRYHAVDTDLQRAKWFNEYVNNLAGLGDCAFGMRVGDYKSIDRTQEFLPLIKPSVTKKKTEETMPFFEPAGDASKRKPPPPIARKPKPQEGEEDRQMRSSVTSSTVPVTVTTETYKFNPDMEDTPRSTSNIPIVETKTHKVTYEKDGIPYETEDSILISAHSVTTKSQTIDTTTYKTERDGVVETRVERKVTVTSDDEDLDHDLLLRLAIQEVTNMNQGLEVEKIECVKQIEEVNG